MTYNFLICPHTWREKQRWLCVMAQGQWGATWGTYFSLS